MANLKNCKRCGKVFNGAAAEELCPSCLLEDAKDIKKVTDYLRKNPLASIMEVHLKTGVPQQQLLRMVKGGTLKLRQPGAGLKCRLCGKDIKAGAYCESCREKTGENFNK
ncbi:MAG TPA: MerR family transcriptional regulator [Candidatus Goldiibacteriota bacterium]|nr:MerR family transcriptional regulator [Candidatus Goldiibacteriota bacterium]